MTFRNLQIIGRIYEICMFIMALAVLIGLPVLIFFVPPFLEYMRGVHYIWVCFLELFSFLLLLSILRLWWRRKMRRAVWNHDPSFTGRTISPSLIAYAEDRVKEADPFELLIYHAERDDGEEGFVASVRVTDNHAFNWNGDFHPGRTYEAWRKAKKEGEQILKEKVKENRDRW